MRESALARRLARALFALVLLITEVHEKSCNKSTLVYERALRGYLNNRNSVHFQPEVHGFFSTLKKHNKTMLLRTGSYTKALITCFLVHFLIKSTRA